MRSERLTSWASSCPEADYRVRTPRSAALVERAAQVMPGGDTSTTAHFLPHPLVVHSAEGARIRDADGHEYLDFMNHFTALMLGHRHPAVLAALQDQLLRGTSFGAPTELQFELARLLCRRVPGLEQVRFCASGSEASMMAVRAARAFTGRQKVLKFEGAYHGNHALGEISLLPIPGGAGPVERPRPLALDRSIGRASLESVVTAPFNRLEIAAEQVKRHSAELAAVIVEPMLTGLGMIPPEPGFLEGLREVTREHDVLLIFDEVVTLRVAPGGMQQRSGVRPDLTALGKLIGGGLPIGAFGGRRDVMSLFDPRTPAHLWHATTFGGSPLSMAAGLATLRALPEEAYQRLERLGEELRRRLELAFARSGVRGGVTGVASLWNLHLGGHRPRDAREAIASSIEAGRIPALLHLALLRRGIFVARRLMLCLSTPMEPADLEQAAGALEEALLELRPRIEHEAPHLLG